MICFVCGQLCSGKSLYAKYLASIEESIFLEVSDIVKQIIKTEDRRHLQTDTKHLHSKIAEEILCIYVNNRPKQLIVSGARQKEILENFPLATLIWIDCPKNDRAMRYSERLRKGDDINFEKAEQGDIELGILEVKKYILEDR